MNADILFRIAKRAYKAYKMEWINENPYAYVHNVENPKSFKEFVKNDFYDTEKTKQYLFFFANQMHPEWEEYKEERMEAESLFSMYINAMEIGRIPEWMLAENVEA